MFFSPKPRENKAKAEMPKIQINKIKTHEKNDGAPHERHFVAAGRTKCHTPGPPKVAAGFPKPTG